MTNNGDTAPRTPDQGELPGSDFLGRAENAALLMAMHETRRFTYQQLAVATKTSVGALRKRFAENPEWRRLLRVVGSVPSRRAGPKQKLFQLTEEASDAIGRYVAAPEPDMALLYSLPQLESVKEMLRTAQLGEKSAPGLSFQLHRRAREKLSKIEAYIEDGQKRRILACSEEMSNDIAMVRERLAWVGDMLLYHSGERRLQTERLAAEAAAASRRDTGLPEYFSFMPERSISGYGGAIMAKADTFHSDVARLDAFFANRIVGDREAGGFVGACGHSLGEVLRLSIFDAEWIGIAGRILDGIRKTTRLASQKIIVDTCRSITDSDGLDPGLRRDIRSFTARHAVDAPASLPGMDELADALLADPVR